MEDRENIGGQADPMEKIFHIVEISCSDRHRRCGKDEGLAPVLKDVLHFEGE
jgi:hypothetical protein